MVHFLSPNWLFQAQNAPKHVVGTPRSSSPLVGWHPSLPLAKGLGCFFFLIVKCCRVWLLAFRIYFVARRKRFVVIFLYSVVHVCCALGLSSRRPQHYRAAWSPLWCVSGQLMVIHWAMTKYLVKPRTRRIHQKWRAFPFVSLCPSSCVPWSTLILVLGGRPGSEKDGHDCPWRIQEQWRLMYWADVFC